MWGHSDRLAPAMIRPAPSQPATARRSSGRAASEGGAGLDAAHLAERLRRRDGPHPAQGLGRHHVPAAGHGPGHHGRVEVEEGRGDRAGADPAERGGPGREVPGPEAAQARLAQRGAAARCEVGDGVDGFGGDPQVAGGGPAPPVCSAGDLPHARGRALGLTGAAVAQRLDVDAHRHRLGVELGRARRRAAVPPAPWSTRPRRSGAR